MLELEYPYLPLFDNIEVSIAVKPFGGRWTNHTKKDEINDELQDFLETMSQGKLRACENSKCKPDVIHFYRRMIGQSIVVTFYSNAIVRTRQHLVEKGILDEKRIVRGLRGENFIPSEAFVKSVSKAELMEINRFHARQIIHARYH